MHQLLLLCYDGTLIIVQHSPVIMNRPWSSPTPLIPPLAEGRLATSFQALPPSFSRISVYFNLPERQCSPPATTYTCSVSECNYHHSILCTIHFIPPSHQTGRSVHMRAQIGHSSVLPMTRKFRLVYTGSPFLRNVLLRWWLRCPPPQWSRHDCNTMIYRVPHIPKQSLISWGTHSPGPIHM